ncbi:MAG: VTC domain-containing protein [bacterium]|nr:VTC domain-containing protein [bacterium]
MTYRYERKFHITDLDRAETETIIKHHPAMFSAIFRPRIIYNLYLDTPWLKNYHDNIDGAASREKMRIRWYDNQTIKNLNINETPSFNWFLNPPANAEPGDTMEVRPDADNRGGILEIKQKEGLLGKKISFTLPPFSVHQTSNPTPRIVRFRPRQTTPHQPNHPGSQTEEYLEYQELIKQFRLPRDLEERLLTMQPVLMNFYTRWYYRSADRKFRVTIDTDLGFRRLTETGMRLKATDSRSVILELKYPQESAHMADSITSAFPFRLTRSSKYVSGIEELSIY